METKSIAQTLWTLIDQLRANGHVGRASDALSLIEAAGGRDCGERLGAAGLGFAAKLPDHSVIVVWADGRRLLSVETYPGVHELYRA